MLVKTKERKKTFFKDIPVGQIFREGNNEEVFMKIDFADDYICCPICEVDISIKDATDKTHAVKLKSGLVYEFEPYSAVNVTQGAFIED